MMIHQPDSWLKAVEEKGAAIQNQEFISKKELLEELILMGLRLKDGIGNETFQKHFGKNIAEIFKIEKLKNDLENSNPKAE